MQSFRINLPVTIGLNVENSDVDFVVDTFVKKLQELDTDVRSMQLFDVFDINIADARMEIFDAVQANPTSDIEDVEF